MVAEYRSHVSFLALINVLPAKAGIQIATNAPKRLNDVE
jgi:hypothetical protein